jgi:RNA polymerase sigma-70 factor (ECF subfamily)
MAHEGRDGRRRARGSLARDVTAPDIDFPDFSTGSGVILARHVRSAPTTCLRETRVRRRARWRQTQAEPRASYRTGWLRGTEVSSELDTLADEALLERFQRGDAEAFEVLLGRYERPLYNFVLRSVRDPEKAADLIQEVFLRVIQRSDQFQGQSKLSTWLYSIARNLCIDHGRRMVFRRHRSLDAPLASDDGKSATLGDRVPAPTPEADRDSIARELQGQIAAAVEELPEDQREVFLMRQVQGLAFKDIAEIVGVSENTIKSRMRYALERLQAALEEYRDYAKELG